MRHKYLRDAAPGDLVDDVFLLSNKQLSAGSNGKQFIKGFISDRTMQVTARLWNATPQLSNSLPENGFVRVRGRIENYQGNLQLIIDAVHVAKPGTFELDDLMPHTNQDIPTMFRRLAEILGSLQNRHLGSLVHAYLDDEALMASFCRAPAAVSMHHAFIGGLLEHTLNAVEVADAICRFYPGLNRDLVISGIFLHDIAKTWELSYESAFAYTDGGQLVGHIVKSAMWVEHKAKEAQVVLGERIPQAVIDVVQHIILSHHGQLEFGAPKTPATPEAIAVHMIENLDAKLMSALFATRGGGASAEGNWTEYMKTFNGRLFRPDVAPPEGLPGDDEPPVVPPAGKGKVVADDAIHPPRTGLDATDGGRGRAVSVEVGADGAAAAPRSAQPFAPALATESAPALAAVHGALRGPDAPSAALAAAHGALRAPDATSAALAPVHGALRGPDAPPAAFAPNSGANPGPDAPAQAAVASSRVDAQAGGRPDRGPGAPDLAQTAPETVSGPLIINNPLFYSAPSRKK